MAKERITTNANVPIVPGKSGRDAATRNTRSRVFLDDGESFSVTVKTPSDETVIASGRASAESDKMCALYLTLRAEADVDTPVAGVVE